jgi:hypothetical protein
VRPSNLAVVCVCVFLYVYVGQAAPEGQPIGWGVSSVPVCGFGRLSMGVLRAMQCQTCVMLPHAAVLQG